MITIALDAMGGDTAPHDVVAGAVEAVRKVGDINVVAVGNEAAVKPLVPAEAEARINVVHAPEYVGMNEAAATSLRRKKRASILVAAKLVAERRAAGIVSAGNTGATVVAATLAMGMIEGIKRPGIAIPVPTANGICALIDVGANIHCKPVHLLHYAMMGKIYMESLTGIESPRIGLLNVGEEQEKGSDMLKETFSLIEDSPLNFIGNVEGRDIFSGKCDVVVTDGFVGNVLLKAMEGMAENMLSMLRKSLSPSTLQALSSDEGFKNLGRKLAYEEYGGAPLLGVNGVCIICHGRSGPAAIKNALLAAKRFVTTEMVERIRREIPLLSQESTV